MSSQKRILVTQISANQSLSASFTSPATVVKYLDNCSYQINITTTDSTGTFFVEVSNDYVVYETTNQVETPGNWVPLTLAGGTPTVGGDDDTIVINLNQLPFYAVRLRYVSQTAGTGICNIFIADKAISG